MELVKGLVEVLATRAPYLLLLLGLLSMAGAIIPFKFERGGWAIRNPNTRETRIALSLLGLAILGASGYLIWTSEQKLIQRLTEKRITSYFSYATISGSQSDICRISHSGWRKECERA